MSGALNPRWEAWLRVEGLTHAEVEASASAASRAANMRFAAWIRKHVSLWEQKVHGRAATPRDQPNANRYALSQEGQQAAFTEYLRTLPIAA